MDSASVNVKIVTVSGKSQITLPKALLDRLGMPPGSKVRLWVERGILRVKPVKLVPKRPRRS